MLNSTVTWPSKLQLTYRVRFKNNINDNVHLALSSNNVWGLCDLKRQSEWGLGEGEIYESRKGFIVDGGCKFQTTRSYSDRCGGSMNLRPER